jgi:hypothetical protein
MDPKKMHKNKTTRDESELLKVESFIELRREEFLEGLNETLRRQAPKHLANFNPRTDVQVMSLQWLRGQDRAHLPSAGRVF